jgi:AcrR family transcriptional regulator
MLDETGSVFRIEDERSKTGNTFRFVSMTPSTIPEPKRADARRNRERLLAAARTLFAESGADVPLAAAAKAAGVGVGTAYRHFPTQEALVEAVYRDEVAQLCAAADELLRELAPDEALAAWMQRFVDYMPTKRGMSGALRAVVASGSDVYAETRVEILAALSRLLAAGVAAGTVRDDVDAEDVIGAMAAIWALPDDPEKAQRILMVIVDGLRAG